MRHIDKDRVVDLFCQLARIKSPSGQEKEISDFIGRYLQELGVIPVFDSYGNMIVQIPGEGSPLILCAHMDTVAVGEDDEIVPVIEDGFVRSQGNTILGADNKDAVTAILEALRIAKELGQSTRALELVFTREEETISRGATNLDYSLLEGKECIISDNAESYGTVVVGAPFCFTFDIKVEGRRCHTKDPSKGVSVAEIIAEASREMPRGKVDSRTSSTISFQIVGLKGDLQIEPISEERTRMSHVFKGRNNVPDLGYVFGEVRGSDIEVVEETLAKIEKTFQMVSEEEGGQVDFKSRKLAPGYLFDASEHLVKLAFTVFRDQGVEPKTFEAIGGSDANIFNGKGIKTIVINSAHRNNHTFDEYLVIEDLTRLTDFFLRLITRTG